MGVSSPAFLLAFPFVWLLYSSLRASQTRFARWACLLCASAAFIAIKDPISLAGIVLLSAITFYAGPRVAAARGKSRFWIVSSVGLCAAALIAAKIEAGLTLLGISFFTLQMMGYLLDIYRGTLEPEPSFWIYLTSIAAFPYITSGPLPRTAETLPQLRKPILPSFETGTLAVFRISAGLAKKSAGDLLSMVADQAFKSPETINGLHAWTGVIALSAYYYADLSGYTDIAVGLCQLLGIKIPENFRCPYFATSVAEFWRRWHMSVNDFFREYLFVPLYLRKWPGPLGRLIKGGKRRTQAALIVTMVVIGLWHGLTFNNFLWGIYNGVLILIPVTFGLKKHPRSVFRRALAISFTFYLVLIGRVLTRAPTLKVAWSVWTDMHAPSHFALGIFSGEIVAKLLLAVLGLIVPHVFDWYAFVRPNRPFNLHWARAFTVLFVAFTICFNVQGWPFLYEHF